MKKDYRILHILLSLPWTDFSQDKIKSYLSGVSSWDTFINIAMRERLCGSLYYILEKNSLTNYIPTEINKKLYIESMSIKGFNILQLKNIDKILAACEKEKIPLTIIKGYAFLKHLYPSLSMRLANDIDIIADYPPPKKLLSLLRDSGYSKVYLHDNLMAKKNFIPFDIHKDPVNSDRISTRTLAFKTGAIDFNKNSLPWGENYKYITSPSWIDHLIICAIHSEKHGYKPLYLIYEIAWILHSKINSHDREFLLNKLTASNSLKSFYRVLKYIETNFFYSSSLSNRIKSQIKLSYMDNKLVQLLINGEDLSGIGFLLPIFSIKKMSHKIRFIWENVFPDKKVLKQISGVQNEKILWLCYLHRIILFIKEFFKLLIRISKHLIKKKH